MRAFLYARVSTIDKEQSPDPQLSEMRAYCLARGWEWEEFFDIASADKKRPEFDRMLALIRKQKCNVLLCRHFDRVGRSTIKLAALLDELKTRGIAFVSLNQSIDTSTPMGTMIFHVLAAVAEFEKAMIRERVMLGMADAKDRLSRGLDTQRGKNRWAGRPRLDVDRAAVAHLRNEGLSLRDIAERVGVSEASVRRLLKSNARPRQKPTKKAVQK